MVSLLDKVKCGYTKLDCNTCLLEFRWNVWSIKAKPRPVVQYRGDFLQCIYVILHSPVHPSRRSDLVIDHIPQCLNTMSCGLILPR